MASPPKLSVSFAVGAAVATTAAAAAVLAASRHYAAASSSASPEKLASKRVQDSSIRYSSKISPDMCNEQGRVYGGELLKLIDVAAGTVAAKHAGGPCLTISVDRVIFLQEIMVADVVHFAVAVNRSWGSSMEIGVRVTRETPTQREPQYCCHSYLTFVARAPPLPPISLLQSLGLQKLPPKPRAKVPQLQARTTLEQKRYLLAGRRRAHRLLAADATGRMLAAFREQMLGLEKQALEEEALDAEMNHSKEDLIEHLQKEMMVEAWLKGDKDLTVEGDWVVASIEGFMDPVRLPLAEIQKASAQRGHGGYRRITVPRSFSSEISPAQQKVTVPKTLEDHSPLAMEDTLVMSLWIVRPQHCNSKQILFGGALMRWVEETSSIAAGRIRHGPWSSAAIDSLTFKSAVYPGEVVYVRSCVIKVWDSSVECWALAMAEDRNSPVPTTRLVSEAFFTLVAIDAQSGRPMKGGLRSVRAPGGAAQEVVDGADKRREERLLEKRILQRVYA